jgi:hypothetical protein
MGTLPMTHRVTPKACSNDVIDCVFALVLPSYQMLRRALKILGKSVWKPLDETKVFFVTLPHWIGTIKAKMILLDEGGLPESI